MVIHPSLVLISFWVFTGAEMRVGEVCSRGGKVPLAKRVGRCMFEVANLLCLFRACMYTRTDWHLSMKRLTHDVCKFFRKLTSGPVCTIDG